MAISGAFHRVIRPATEFFDWRNGNDRWLHGWRHAVTCVRRMKFNTTEELIEDISQGKMVVLLDDDDRENEGDLVMAASLA